MAGRRCNLQGHRCASGYTNGRVRTASTPGGLSPPAATKAGGKAASLSPGSRKCKYGYAHWQLMPAGRRMFGASDADRQDRWSIDLARLSPGWSPRIVWFVASAKSQHRRRCMATARESGWLGKHLFWRRRPQYC